MKPNPFGFTLIELMVVVVIIGLLSSAGTVSYGILSRQARDAKRRLELEKLKLAIQSYRSENNLYPNYTGDCAGGLIAYLTPYLTRIEDDPKPTPFNYFCQISPNDFILGAYLEGSNADCGYGCGSTNCSYLIGPYGQLCP